MQKKKPVGQEEMYMTAQEVHKFKKALTDPEFHKYWEEYLKELTDPAGRKEREEFMLEQAKNHDLPPNTELVRPEALFCFKTYTRRILSSQGPKKYIDQKLFVNICTGSFIEPPSKIEVMHEGAKMFNWSVPYTLSKPRAARDNKQEVCMSIDVIYNTKCAGLSRFEEFKKMMCDTAIDAINTFLKEYNEKASQNYKLLSKLKYKGGTPEFILTKKRPDADKSALSENLKTENHLPQAVREIYDGQTKAEQKKEQEKEEDKAEEVDVDVTASEAIQKQKKSKHSKRIKAHNEEPKYTITETHSSLDLTECFDGPVQVSTKAAAKILPNALAIKIELPGVRSMKNAKLELQERRIKFEYLQNYILDASLPYFVVESTAKAKYDKDKETLLIDVEVNKAKYASTAAPAEETPAVVDLTMLGKKKESPEAKEELEVEKIEMPSLFNIYKPSAGTETGTKKKDGQEEKKLDIKFRAEPEPDFDPTQTPSVEEQKSSPLITEVEAKKAETKAQEAEKAKQQETEDLAKAPRVEGKYDLRQVGDMVILLYRIKGYKKEHVVSKLTNNEMLVEVYDPNTKSVQRTCVTLFQPILASESAVETFIDFISVKLKKADPNKKWDSLGYNISQLTEQPVPAPKETKKQDEEKKDTKETKKEEKQTEEERQRQDVMEKAEDALEQRERRTPTQYIHFGCPIIYDIYQLFSAQTLSCVSISFFEQ